MFDYLDKGVYLTISNYIWCKIAKLWLIKQYAMNKDGNKIDNATIEDDNPQLEESRLILELSKAKRKAITLDKLKYKGFAKVYRGNSAVRVKRRR